MPRIVLLPGLACDGEVWAEITPALEKLGLAAAPHLVDVHFHHPTLPAMATALLRGLPRPGADAPADLVLIGHSMGGMLALEVQRQAPHRVAALALLGSSARPDTPELLRLRSEAIEMFEQGFIDHVLWANVAFAFHPDHAADARIAERYLGMLRRAGAAQLIAQNRAVMARIDSRPHLAAIGCPLLVACGEADLLTPPEHSREIAAAQPAARLDVLAGCGHMLTLERPAAVAGLLVDWLRSLPLPPRGPGPQASA